MGAHSREGNIALEVDRPELPTIPFAELKADLLMESDEKINFDNLGKPGHKFLDISKEADDQDDQTVKS